ncbi:hypothetical protein CYMTET_30458 [Cymbomonas tetramitiformis]|uniref:Chromo domain-containing protein n=1 Tax=Cymbomonas tetramitiformis TaxID=36881 RepID=A0AAE0FJ30_9CHLO|nr:hypothetical protein CYMTET_30458 [Cymbomonas tetramitiformis]
MFRSFIDDNNPEDWDSCTYATNVEFAINDSRSGVTGFTPFELCYDWSWRSSGSRISSISAMRKLSKRRHGPLAVTERFYSDIQAGLPEADRGAPVACRLQLSPTLRKEIVDWKVVRWTGYSKAHDSWRTRDKLERGAPLQQLKDFEADERLVMEGQVRDAALRRREQRRDTAGSAAVAAGASLAYLLARPWEEEFEDHSDECLP